MKCMLCMQQAGHFNKAALAHEQDGGKKTDELVHFNVTAFLSVRMYQGYALHRILIYFHIIKYWHQRLEIMERSWKLFFFFLPLSLLSSIRSLSVQMGDRVHGHKMRTLSGVTERFGVWGELWSSIQIKVFSPARGQLSMHNPHEQCVCVCVCVCVSL